jgi:hypothetical protein
VERQGYRSTVGSAAPYRCESQRLSIHVGSVKVKSRPPHFDSIPSPADILALVQDPCKVAKHAFYPFIQFEKRWTRFAEKGQAGKDKCRLVRYAARRDACIFSHYRALLSERYEAAILEAGLSESVIGYRRVKSATGSGKCNINFASEAFSCIRAASECYVYTLDISKFFENLDHILLRKSWCDLLGTSQLPKDHFQVYKAVTRFAFVDRTRLYEVLKIIGTPPGGPAGTKKYLLKREDIPLQLCTSKEFRSKVKPLIQVNKTGRGVPQGASISDVLSNLYLFSFDQALHDWVTSLGGEYYRYSDDILIVIPKTEDQWKVVMDRVTDLVQSTGNKLEIHPDKCSAYHVGHADPVGSTNQICTLVHQTGCKNGIEYLGFRYDGRNIFLRESTRGKLNRAIVESCRRLAKAHVHHNPALTLAELRSTINRNRVYERVGRVKDFEPKALAYRQWTFWTYAKRCELILGQDGRKIYRQLSGYKRFVNTTLNSEIERAFRLEGGPLSK